MVIVITDGYTLNPGDLSWDAFKQIGEVKYYDRTGAGDITERCREATIIITNKTPLSAEAIEAASKLKVIAVTATGYNIIDTSAAKQKGIIVCNVPEYGTDSVAQHTIALLLELTNSTGIHSQSVLKGEWEKSIDWSYTKKPVTELSGKTIGIVGFGRIGRRVAEISKAFGMKVIAVTKHPFTKTEGGDKKYFVDNLYGIDKLSEVIQRADFTSIHTPLNKETENMIGSTELDLMKRSSYLINVARAQVVKKDALLKSLKDGKIAGAAFDVFWKEPVDSKDELLKLDNFLLTPHIAGWTHEAIYSITDIIFINIERVLRGQLPLTLVNKVDDNL